MLGVEPRGSATPSFHFIGIQAVDARVFADLPRGRSEFGRRRLHVVDRLDAGQHPRARL